MHNKHVLNLSFINLNVIFNFISFNFTPFSGHMTQEAAAAEIESQFLNLLAGFTCSTHIKHFICSLYTPMCEPVSAGEQHDEPKGIDHSNDNFTHILVTFWSPCKYLSLCI